MNWWDRVIDINEVAFESFRMRAEHWILTEVLAPSTLVQGPAILIAFALAFLLSRPLERQARRDFALRVHWMDQGVRFLVAVLIPLIFPLLALAVLWLAVAAAVVMGWPHGVVTTVASLLAAWIVIRLVTTLIGNIFWARLAALLAWTVAALNILGLLVPVILFLDGTAVQIAGHRLSVLTTVKAVVVLGLLLWIAAAGGRFLERRVRTVQGLTPSVQVLLGKLVKVGLFTLALVVTLNTIGLDLTAFAVFTGAVGVGVGFGLQKVVSNLVSGVILLLDKSIKPGDVIEVGDTYGWVAALGARYVAVTTRDGKEWLIPNEDLITHRVVNWSFTSDSLRLLVPFVVAYDADLRKAMALAVEAASRVSRVLNDPAPACRLTAFGQYGVALELRVWIRDPRNGIINVRSDILLAMWDLFHKNDVRIPLPQQDLHVKDGSALRVVLEGDKGRLAAE